MHSFYYTWLEGAERPVAEAFASQQSRDQALGPVGSARFGRTSGAALGYTGHALHSICIGHWLGEPGFQAVADFVLPHVRAIGEETGEFSVVIARVKYTLIDGAWIAEPPTWLATGPLDQPKVKQTCMWLARAFKA